MTTVKSIEEIKKNYSENWETISEEVKKYVTEWLQYEGYTEENGEIECIEVVDVQNYEGINYDFSDSRAEGAVAYITIASGEDLRMSDITVYVKDDECRIEQNGALNEGIYWNAPTEHFLLKTLELLNEDEN